ncbi:amine oxidase [Pisolithus tinctorius]|nr:amine oxidase [Pisolithus tinctorius]
MTRFRLSIATVLLSLLSSAVAKDANATKCLADLKPDGAPPNNTKVLILGGGMAGVIAARTLHEQGIDDFVIVEAKHEFGGRMAKQTFGVNGSEYMMDPANPVWLLAKKHNLSMVASNLSTDISVFSRSSITTGLTTTPATFEASLAAVESARALAGQRWQENKTDLDLRSAYKFWTPQEEACEYYQIDYDASQTSTLAAALSYNNTYNPEAGGYSDVDMLSVDQRGIACIVQAEAATFLNTSQVLFNQTVKTIQYNQNGVTVQTTDGYSLTADHALVTFSAARAPDWKREAISSIEMSVYTKIFLQFKEKFWFDTGIGLYADQQKGRYPVWESLDHPCLFPGSGIIFVTVTGDYANYLEQLNKNNAKVMEVLRRMYPDAPDPIDIWLPIWGRAPLFRGSYSSWGAPFVPEYSYNLSAPVNGHLWFAGEATSSKYFGFMHGAYLEGQKAATNIATCIKNPQRCPPTTT